MTATTRAFLVAVALFLAGCATFDPAHPNRGAPSTDETRANYMVWFGGGAWHVRAVAGGAPHRFQGTVASVGGSVTAVDASDSSLAEGVALVGGAVQFDFETGAGPLGFDLRSTGECARFDLLLDGKRASSHVRLGPRGVAPAKLPFERCR